jgi:hypothetical protein
MLLSGCVDNTIEGQIRQTVQARARETTIAAGVAATLRAGSTPTIEPAKVAISVTWAAEALGGNVEADVNQTRQAAAIETRNGMPTVLPRDGLVLDQFTCEQARSNNVEVSGETWVDFFFKTYMAP